MQGVEDDLACVQSLGEKPANRACRLGVSSGRVRENGKRGSVVIGKGRREQLQDFGDEHRLPNKTDGSFEEPVVSE